MTVSNINAKLFTDLSAINGRTLSTLTAVNGQSILNEPADPSTISDLQLWLSARFVGGLSNGDPVSTWPDQSGNSRDATGTASARPTYNSSGGANNQPYLSFDGGNDEMSLTNFLNGSGYTAIHCFIVFKITNDPPSGDPTAGAVLSGSNSWGQDANGNHWPYTDGTVYDGSFTTSRKTTTNPTTSLTNWVCYEVLSKSSLWERWINGAGSGNDHYSTGTNTVGFGTGTLKLGIGGSGLQRLLGSVEEIILYSRDITSGEITTVKDYLNYWYGLSIA